MILANLQRENHGLARTIKESIYKRVNNPTVTAIWLSIPSPYIGQSYLAPKNLELTNIMGLCTVQPSVGLLRLCHSIGMCTEQQNILDMPREHHHLNMDIEHHRTHISHWYSLFPQTWWSPVAVWSLDESLSWNNWSSVQRTKLNLILQQNKKSHNFMVSFDILEFWHTKSPKSIRVSNIMKFWCNKIAM